MSNPTPETAFADFNWSDLYNTAKAVTWDALPNGDYEVKVVETDAVRTQNGKPMLKAKLEVVNGQFAKRKILTQFVLSVENETALSIFFRQMKAFGLDEHFFATVPPGQLGPVAQALMNRTALVTVGQREFPAGSGQMRNEVKNVQPSRIGGMPTTMPGAAASFGGPPVPGAPAPSGPPVPTVPAGPPAFQQPPASGQSVPGPQPNLPI